VTRALGSLVALAAALVAFPATSQQVVDADFNVVRWLADTSD
jgi:hypothetical protein